MGVRTDRHHGNLEYWRHRLGDRPVDDNPFWYRHLDPDIPLRDLPEWEIASRINETLYWEDHPLAFFTRRFISRQAARFGIRIHCPEILDHDLFNPSRRWDGERERNWRRIMTDDLTDEERRNVNEIMDRFIASWEPCYWATHPWQYEWHLLRQRITGILHRT